LLAHGLEMERGDYTLIAKGTTGHRLDSMMQGETFAGILNPPWDSKAVAAGMTRLADHREVLPDYPGGVFAVTREWATASHEVLVKFLRVWKGALGWAHDERNRDEVIKLVAVEEKLDEKGAGRKLAQLPKDGQLNLAGLQTVLDLRVQFRLTPALGNQLKSYFDASFYREASAD
jgi:ABC-type nitrate/sulfonate/bicarbonate transport system substrate-binding protein